MLIFKLLSLSLLNFLLLVELNCKEYKPIEIEGDYDAQIIEYVEDEVSEIRLKSQLDEYFQVFESRVDKTKLYAGIFELKSFFNTIGLAPITPNFEKCFYIVSLGSKTLYLTSYSYGKEIIHIYTGFYTKEKVLYEDSLHVSQLKIDSLAFKPLYFGTSESFGGMPQECESMVKMVEDEDVEGLTKWLHAPNNELMAYGYFGLDMLRMDGVELEKSLLEDMELFYNANLEVETSQGCIVKSERFIEFYEKLDPKRFYWFYFDWSLWDYVFGKSWSGYAPYE